MKLILPLIRRYKRLRDLRRMNDIYTAGYAMVGFGNHAVHQLLPAIQYLGVPLRYVCCTSTSKAEAVARKYPGLHGTTSLREVLDDKEIRGVFVAATPSAHFTISRAVLESGKALFVEKPPCTALEQLDRLIETAKAVGNPAVTVGFQRRFSPVASLLQQELRGAKMHSYHYRFLTGAYPEGDALTDLFIHPLDLVSFLFGEAKVRNFTQTGKSARGEVTLFLVLEHRQVMGCLELSTAYTWKPAVETLEINTQSGIYRTNCADALDYTEKIPTFFGLPTEKVFRRTSLTRHLLDNDGFAPTTANHSIVKQGFFGEILDFARRTEGKMSGTSPASLENVRPTFVLIDEIRQLMD